MKKLITGVLATLACLACFTPCVAGCSDGEDTPTSSSGPSVVYDATGAAGYLEAQYKEKDKSGRKDYELPNTTVFQGNTYNVEWKVGDKDGNAIVGVQAIKGETTTLIDVDVTLAADLDYTLFATVTDVNGESATIKINRKVIALAQLVPLAIKEAPVAEKAYKFHVYQGANGTDIYLNGQIANKYYLGTTTEYDDGIDVYVEAVEGKEGTFRMYFNETSTGENGEEVVTKKYIDVVKSGTHTNAKYFTEADSNSTEWVFDAEYKTMVTTLEETKFYLGADGTYETVEPQSKREEGYYMGYLVGQIDRANATAEDQVNQTIKELSVGSTYAGATTLTLSSNEDRIYPDAKITWAIAEPVEGVSVSAPSANNESVVLTIADRETAATVKLTATVTHGEGEAAVTATQDFEVTLAPNTTDGILAAALAMKDGASFGNEVTLEGQITNIQTPFDSEYGNVTVDMVVNGKTVTAYRLVGTGADAIGIGDTISVSGILTNYKGAVQFDKGCTIVSSTEGNLAENTLTAAEQITAAYALAEKDSLTYRTTLTGVITKIGTAYDAENENITVTIVVDGDEAHPIDCYRLSGDVETLQKLKEYDTITVEGVLTRYDNKTVQFRQGCELKNYVEGQAPETPTLTAEEILTQAYALEKDTEMQGTHSLTGKIISVDEAYSSQYKNVTVTIEVEGFPTMPMKCYRMKGDGADILAVGDTITVTGKIKNYNGTVEFDAGCTFTDRIANPNPDPVYTTPEEIVNAAYALEVGASLSKAYTLTGVITEIDSAYNSSYNNVSVIISVAGKEIGCYRMKGDGADVIKTGDTITVTGILTRYNESTVQFGTGCTLDSYVPVVKTDADKVAETLAEIAIATVYSDAATTTLPTAGEANSDVTIAWAIEGTGATLAGNTLTVAAPSAASTITLTATVTSGEAIDTKAITVKLIANDKATVFATAKEMAAGEYFGNETTLTGTVASIDTAWSSKYDNITVTIKIDGTEDLVQCYRLAGGETLAVDTQITVKGIIANRKGALQFNSGCTYVEGDGFVIEELTIAQAVALGAEQDKGKYTALEYYVTGTVINIANAEKGRLTIADANGDTLYVYGIADIATLEKDIAVGDTIKLCSTVGNYNLDPQLKDAKVVEFVEATPADICKVLAEKMALTVNTDIKEAGAETLAIVGATYSDVTISWASDNACAVVDGATVTYTLPDAATTVILTATITLGDKTETKTFNVTVAAKPVAGQITVNKIMSEMATANGWGSSGNVAATAVALDDVVSFTIASKGNSGKYYSDGIRLYATDSTPGAITFTAASGYELVSIKITTVTGTYAFLQIAGDATEDYSNAVANVSGSSVTFTTVRNGDGGKQVRISSIEVVYKAV